MADINPEYVTYAMGIVEMYGLAGLGMYAGKFLEKMTWKYMTRNLPENELETKAKSE